VAAFNHAGCGPWSAVATFAAPIQAPVKLSLDTATSVQWEMVAAEVGASYVVEQKTDGGAWVEVARADGRAPPSVVARSHGAWALPSVAGCDQACFRVAAFNRAGTGPWSQDLRYNVHDCAFAGVTAASFGTGGALYFLGTDYGTKAYANPHGGAHGVKAAYSNTSMESCYGTEPDFVQHDHGSKGKCCKTDTITSVSDRQRGSRNSDSWMAVDFGAANLFLPTHYALRTSGTHGDFLINWRLEASNDGCTWEALREHRNDSWGARLYDSSEGKGAGVESWPVPTATSGFYRHFRILRLSRNAANPGYDEATERFGFAKPLYCAGIELFGVLASAQ
jgi:hypothetical protein